MLPSLSYPTAQSSFFIQRPSSSATKLPAPVSRGAQQSPLCSLHLSHVERISSSCICRHGSSINRCNGRRLQLHAIAPPRDLCTTATSSSAPPPVVDSLGARLKAWVIEHSRTLPTQLTPVRRSNGSYGLTADEPIRPGQVLVRVPRRLLLTAQSAAASPVCGHLVAEAGLSEWQALLLHLLTERALGPRSFWAPYIDTLPQDMSYHPLLWGPERLAWLTGSPLEGQLRERQEQVSYDCEVLQVAGANELPPAVEWRQNTGTDLVTPFSVGWAASLLLSRSFSLDLTEEEPLEGDMSYWGSWGGHGPGVLALVPWADMAEHCASAGPDSCAAYQPELGAVTLTAHRPYAPGQTVMDSHGSHLSPVDMFLDYGVEDAGGSEGGGEGGAVGEGGEGGLEEGGREREGGGEEAGGLVYGSRHRFDMSPADVASPRSSRNAVLLAALAAVQGEGCRLALSCRGPDTASLTFLRAMMASDVELVRAGWRVKAIDRDVELACRVMGSLSLPSSAATEGAVLAALEGAVRAALNRFPTTLKQDEDRLAGRAGHEGATGPERLALVAIVSQKRALMGSAAVIASWREKLAAGCPVGELYDEDYDMYDNDIDDEDENEREAWAGGNNDADGWGRGR